MPARKPARKAHKSPKPGKAAKARTAARRPAARKGGPQQGQQQRIPMRNVTGQLVVSPAKDALDWYAKVFGAKELVRQPGPNGTVMHAQMRLGDTNFMVSDPFGQPPAQANGAYLHIHHKDVQQMWDRALSNGATAVLPLANQFWGDKYGQLRDPFGQLWSLAWPAKMTEAEKERLRTQAMAMQPPSA